MSSPTKNNSRPGLTPIATSSSGSRAPPLAGRPPFATDDDYDDIVYETPRAPMTPSRVQFSVPQTPMTPTQRIRAQMILPAATANTAEREKRTSAYDVYDDYVSGAGSASTSKPSSSTSRTLTPTKSTNPFNTPLDSPSHPAASSSSSPPRSITTTTSANPNRASGIGALLMNMSDSDSEFDSDDEDAQRAEIKRGTMTKNTLVGAGASNNKNAALAAAVGGNAGGAAKVTFAVPANAPPVPVVQNQQPPLQPQSPPRQGQQPMKIAAPQPGYAAPIAALNFGQPFGPGKNPFEPEQIRNPFNPAGPSMPHPQTGQRPEMAQIPNANGRTIPMPAPLRIVPPPANLHIQTSGINPFDQPGTPYTPFSPNGPNKPQTPHPLLPPVTPITPAFIRPTKSMSMSSGGSGGSAGGGGGVKAIPPPAAIKFDERMVVPIKGGMEGGATPRPRNPNRGAGDEFWRRFSMVARKDGIPTSKERSGPGSAPRPSSWLATSRASNSRYTRTVWVVGILLVFGIMAGIGCGVYFTRGSPAHQLPKTIGGSADQAATYSTTSTGVAGGLRPSSTSLHVSPTRVIAREEVVQTAAPVIHISPSPRHVHHLRMLEKRDW